MSSFIQTCFELSEDEQQESDKQAENTYASRSSCENLPLLGLIVGESKSKECCQS